MKRRIAEKFGVRAAAITVYTVFYRLERDGYIAKRSDGYYYVTDKGVGELREGIRLLREVAGMLEGSLGEERDY